MLSTSPSSRYVGPFHNGCNDIDDAGDGTSKSNCRPLSGNIWWVVELLLVVVGIQGRRVKSGIEPESCDVNNPDTVEVNDHVEPRSSLLVRLEKDFLPIDLC